MTFPFIVQIISFYYTILQFACSILVPISLPCPFPVRPANPPSLLVSHSSVLIFCSFLVWNAPAFLAFYFVSIFCLSCSLPLPPALGPARVRVRVRVRGCVCSQPLQPGSCLSVPLPCPLPRLSPVSALEFCCADLFSCEVWGGSWHARHGALAGYLILSELRWGHSQCL